MKKILLLTIIMGLFFASEIMAQTSCDTLWTKTYGGPGVEALRFVRQANNGYILAGIIMAPNATSSDCYVVRTNSIGDTIWTKTYGGDMDEEADCIQETSDGGFIITGRTTSFGADQSDVYLVRTDENGDTLWTRHYGGNETDWGYSVQQTSDDGFIVAGYTNSFGAGSVDVYIVRTNALGDTLWTRTYGEALYDEAFCIQQTSDGGFVIAGMQESVNGGYSQDDAYLIKINSMGDVLWTQTYGGGSSNELAYFVQETTDGGYILAGGSSEEENGLDFYLVKTDSYGDTLWTRTWGGPENDLAYSVKQTNDGGFILTGDTDSFGPSEISSIYIVRTDQDGNTIWTQTYGRGVMDKAFSLDVCSDGTYVIAGYSADPTFNIDGWLLNVYDYTVGIENNNLFSSDTHSLSQNYPNPFNTSTTISCSVENSDKNTNITIYNFTGQKIKTLVNKKLSAGTHQIVWDGTDYSGNAVSSGIYFYKMVCGDKYIGLKKMILMK